MLSKNYRYYCLDNGGDLHSAEFFDAESDEDAIAQISAKHPHDRREVWRGDRLVANLAPKRFSAQPNRLELSSSEQRGISR